MATSAFVVAAMQSGSGKTTATLGLMAALAKRGYTVQGYKVGPDYIDPGFHARVTHRPSHNLDSWMLREEVNRRIFEQSAVAVDVAVIEGVMGIFDGQNAYSNVGSTAHIALTLDLPIILVLDVFATARTAAAMVLGVMEMEPRLKVAGVIANRVGSPGHFDLVRAAVEQVCNVPAFGYLEYDSEMALPERHLGLVPAVEQPAFDHVARDLGRRVETQIDLDLLLSRTKFTTSIAQSVDLEIHATSPIRARIAVARDAAFHFYYEENFRLLERAGAKLAYFSPLAGDKLPEGVDGLYLGGGFPEEFAPQLSAQRTVWDSTLCAIRNGMPTIAECGGYMALAKELILKDGSTYPMAGLFDSRVVMHEKLQGFGYREVSGTEGNYLLPLGETARGHEFHHSTMTFSNQASPAYIVLNQASSRDEGHLQYQCIGGYTHVHFGSNESMADRFVDACAAYRRKRDSQLT